MKAIWKHLSEDEPENQKPPENIEQLIEMLSREGARRFVHVTNFVAKNISMGPAYLGHAFTYASQEAAVLADQIIKYAHLENVKGTVVQFTNMQLVKYKKVVEDLRKLILEYLSTVSSKINEPKKKESERDNKNSVATVKPPKSNTVNSVPAATPAANVTTNGKP